MELNLSKGEFTGFFTVDRIAGNRKAIWVKDEKGRERVLTVGKKNIEFFKDNNAVFEITRTVKMDTYKINGEIVLQIERKRKKHKNYKKQLKNNNKKRK
jgi:hypothetical protein